MTVAKSKADFIAWLGGAGLTLSTLGVAEGVGAMLTFYEGVRAEGCEIDEDGDMILYQWGTRDFKRPATFQLDVTRQFIVPDEDEPYQLSLTFHFKPSAAIAELKSGSEWFSAPDDVAAARVAIEASAAYRAVVGMVPERVELDLSGC